MNIVSKIYLKDIEHITDDSHLKVWVLKIWNFIKKNQVLSIEMIIMDEEATKYQSRVFSQNFSRFRDLIKEGESYIILKSNMAAVKNVNGLVFADFNSIIEQKCTRDSFFDVIGQIVSFRPLETTNPNPSRHYIKITITNLHSVHLNVTIFGSQAHQMSQYLKSNTTVTCVVIVMQFVKLNVWNGIGQAQSHFDVTKMFINSDIVEINQFKKELKADNNGGMLGKKNRTTLLSYSSSYMDDFKGNFRLKTVCEITEPLKEKKFLLVGSIVNIRQTLPWYIIPINVQDHTDTIGLTLFDRDAKRLLDISAFELKKIHEAAGDSLHLFPNQMNVLKNKKFAFIGDITSYNVINYNNIYTVVKLTEDVSIVSDLESKLEVMSVQSVSLNEVPLQSDDVVQTVEKDFILQTNESFTPATVDKSSATNPMKISSDLKRNLHDIYDVDNGIDFSSTKSKIKSMGDGNPLLVPKVEK
ncbi:uncharacterized protein LOC111911742 [Lactuca sativa]|uniref:uncharacterized protein LOC111911742 n=1 Tax=Lactuca sativa TaxID=4236 RepID=UPI000CD9D44E|nr:uncharacterized protein LOC111911742 [Lactuca sativa]